MSVHFAKQHFRTFVKQFSESSQKNVRFMKQRPYPIRVLCTSAACLEAPVIEPQKSFVPNRSNDVYPTKLRRLAVIHDPELNRGTGFSAAERERLCLRGLVPPREQGLQQQIERVMSTYYRQRTNLDKFQFLSLLMDRNTILFYRILVDNFSELAPIVYTPTVADACLKFHDIYRRTRGMYFSLEDRGHFRTMVYNWPSDEVDVIVVTDGSRVLALGDLGCNSMNIPIGKLTLYVAGAGLNPLRVLPVVLDVGTDNTSLLGNPLYLGVPHNRLKGDEYFELIDEWMAAIRLRWPNALIQFEDFSSNVAATLLERYRLHRAPAFNDDIQSTGCIAVATVLSSLRARGKPMSALGEEVIVCAGAGSAGLGVCNAIVQAMVDMGLPEEEAYKRFYLLDYKGLLGTGGDGRVHPTARKYVRRDLPDGMPLEHVVDKVRPTILLGLSGQGSLFTEDIVRRVAKSQETPVILPMSNPSQASECTAEEAFRWTDGRAIFASGSPFADVILPNGKRCHANQANNVYSFPGMGLAVTALRIAVVTDSMFLAAAKRIAELLPDEDVKRGLLFPPVSQLRTISAEIAGAVGMVAVQEGLVRREVPFEALESLENMVEYMKQHMWEPRYMHLVADS